LSFLPEDRGAELRALFFESAAELLQVINDTGLQLEKHPADEELIRSVRRAVHTLKGDSAACGFTKLSEISHELEDILTMQVAQLHGAALAEVILSAVDLFEGMLSAYQKQLDPPSADPVRVLIHRLLQAPAGTHKPAVGSASNIPANFRWSEYEGLMISEALLRGEAVYNVALRIDPNSAMRAAAFQLVRNVLHACGTVIALRPEDNLAAASVEIVEAALASSHPVEHIAHRCRIPAVVSDIRIEEAAQAEESEHQLLGDILEAQAAQVTSRAEEGQDASAKQTAGASAVAAVAESSLRVDAARIDAVMNLVGELIIGKSMLHRTLSEFDKKHAKDPVRAKFAEALSFQSRVLDELHKCVLKIRMVPVEQLYRRFPRVVRDVAKLCGKDVALETSGEHTDLDKGILDALAEPLTHIVRNAVDHGIEPADDRLAAGKPARGTISLNAYHQGTQVVLEIKDDGRGIDLNMVRDQAVRSGIIKQDDANRLLEQDILNLIFEPGFSTAAEVTEISGRGVGMDVVRTVLDRLKGTVHINSVKGHGTTIQLRMPLTLASIQTLLFRVSGRLFAVPLSSVIEITRISDQEIHKVDQREVLRLRDQVLTLVRLSKLSRIHAVDEGGAKKKKGFVVVIGQAEKRFGLLVDSMVGEEELVIKALPGEIISSDLVSGASILGDGTVVLILNVPAILTRLSRSLPLGAIA
jgi:two-component system, chemotaxis family, sensor kinase CheA